MSHFLIIDGWVVSFWIFVSFFMKKCPETCIIMSVHSHFLGPVQNIRMAVSCLSCLQIHRFTNIPAVSHSVHMCLFFFPSFLFWKINICKTSICTHTHTHAGIDPYTYNICYFLKLFESHSYQDTPLQHVSTSIS